MQDTDNASLVKSSGSGGKRALERTAHNDDVHMGDQPDSLVEHSQFAIVGLEPCAITIYQVTRYQFRICGG